ncbi:MAG: CRISPR-associated endoribonuclease Cas6 [Candidatus Bathyarchaeia archaeon]
MHDKKGYKFFCFSNIFPIGDFEVGNERSMLISSPNNNFIKTLAEKFKEIVDNGKYIHIGEMEFKILSIKLLKPTLTQSCRLISATPIIIRIPEKNYERYRIPQEFRKKRYVYWRPQYSFEAFIKQLEENLIKKYNEFYEKKFIVKRIFEIFKFKKVVINHVIIGGKEYKIIGSIWDFYFTYIDKQQRKILEFGIDCGFGERNSLGFGFINVIT